VDYEYSYVSNLFSKETGLTIQQYIILLKVERAKELIMYDDLNLKEISYSLHYSSVPHFCSQFKKVTGMTPSYFKSLKEKNRYQLEDVIYQTENVAALAE
jgi:AraC-like DNA-binding protein